MNNLGLFLFFFTNLCVKPNWGPFTHVNCEALLGQKYLKILINTSPNYDLPHRVIKTLFNLGLFESGSADQSTLMTS